MIRLLAASLALLAGAAIAGPYDQPYALVESGDARETRKEAPATINRIDGASPRNPRRSDPLPPGKHLVSVHFESARGMFRPEYQDIEIDMAPCTRYRLVANYVSRTGGDWKPKVYNEPIGECRKKFAAKK
ncbi:MAG: hypothetical protein OEV46_09080 [Betaproteobacteria bacterium]|jgi:hypothetical protein|nr:hypothetical protein [Betaproteobacteria bacterium]MDH5285096.1 hypothetical protein [Betaproteobacteria bacterium]